MSSINDYISWLKSDIEDYRARVEEVKKDRRWTEDYKKERLSALKNDATVSLRADAGQWWLLTQKTIEDAEKRLAAASVRVDADTDYSKLSYLTREFEATINSPSNPLKKDDQPVDRVKKLAEQLASEKNADKLRALRVAANDIIEADADLKVFFRDFDATRHGPVEEARGEVESLKSEAATLQRTILEVETAMTGARHGGLDPISPWRKEIFGETYDGRVVWRRDDDAA